MHRVGDRRCLALRRQPSQVGGNFSVGSLEGFDYSDALKNADLAWTPELFADYVRDPGTTIPGNRMPALA